MRLTELKKTSKAVSVEKTIKSGDLSITLRMQQDEAFSRAFAMVGEELNAPTRLSKDALRKPEAGQNQMHKTEALLFVIGEYLVAAWNVEDAEGKPLPINGENFLQVFDYLAQSDEGAKTLAAVFEGFAALMDEYQAKIAAVKKKP